MPYTLAQIAGALGLRAEGDGDLPIRAVAEPADAGPDELALAMTPAYADALPRGAARAAMLWEGADWQSMGLSGAIRPSRPRYALSGLSARLDPGHGYPPGVHPSAVIDSTATLGRGVSVGPLAVISAGARIGDGSVIGPHASIGAEATIGPDALIHAGARIGPRVTIGARFIAHPGACVGADGFSFVTPEPSGVEFARASLGAEGTAAAQPWARIHSLGGVTIGDDVELGGNSCIDRGTIRDTAVGGGCKIDNLVQIGHNVVLGRDCMVCAQVGIAGSSVIGDGVVLGGQSGVSDNITVGDRAILGGATVALSNVPAGRVMLGYPAMKMDTHIETYKALRRLPRLLRDIAALKKAVQNPGAND